MSQAPSATRILLGIWRRRRLCGAVALVCLGVGAGIALGLPAEYRASAVLRVEPFRPSKEMIDQSVTALIEDRLKTIRLELMSRPILERVVQEYDLYPDLREANGLGAAVEALRRKLDVKVEGENAFELTCEGRDPQTVAKVANRLPELFATQALEVRRLQALRTSDILKEEMDRLRGEVDQAEGQITAFKVAHLGELPEQLEANMRGLERLTGLMASKTDSLRDTERHRALLAQVAADADTEAGRLRHRHEDLAQEELLARSRWTADHPEVERLDREVSAVKVRWEEAAVQAKLRDTERKRLAAQTEALQQEIKGLNEEARQYQERLDHTPRWAQQLVVLARDYDTLKAKYQAMLSRHVEAELSRELEEKARPSMFHVLSAAAVPTVPAKPDRFSALILALLAAAAAGVLTGAGLELADDRPRGPGEIRERLALPVLAAIPELGGAGERRRLLPRRAG